jgi:hypothetical protein
LFKTPFVVGALVAVLYALPASAQTGGTGEGGPDPAVVRVRIGPLWMNPTLALTNLGIDQNVFNDPPDKDPKRDFTLTVVPATDLWLGIGRTWLTGTIKEEITWYQKYASERSASNTYQAGWKVPLNRLVFDVGVIYATPKDRPGYEIDERAQRQEITYRGKVEIRALSKTLFGVTAESMRIHFDAADVFDGVNLQDAMNRTTTTFGLSVRQQVTPLTSISINATRSQDRFEFEPTRDSDSTSVSGTLSFDPFALVKGSATVGFRDFKPLGPGLPGYQGSTASADLTYTLLGTTRFTFKALRDVEYSYDVTQPYYLETGVDGSVAQQLFGPVDIVARGGLHHLAYRDQEGANVQFVDRVDQLKSYGGGIGFHLGKDFRLGLNVDKVRRESEVVEHRYDNLLFGTSFTYNF